MDFEWANYQWGDHKILKTEDNFLYRKGSKGRATTNTQYMRCASSSCPRYGKYKTDQDGSFCMNLTLVSLWRPQRFPLKQLT